MAPTRKARARPRTEDEAEEEEGEGRSRPQTVSPAKALQSYAINLTEKAAKGLIDPLVGRKNELERAIHVLLRRRKNNPIFVGEAGVGKTAIVEGLALAIHHGDVPPPIQRLRDLRA